MTTISLHWFAYRVSRRALRLPMPAILATPIDTWGYGHMLAAEFADMRKEG
jgi:hypothetical protein